MTVRVNGKRFDFDAKTELYTGERPDSEGTLADMVLNFLLLSALFFDGWEAYPWLVKIIAIPFRGFMNGLGIPY